MTVHDATDGAEGQKHEQDWQQGEQEPRRAGASGPTGAARSGAGPARPDSGCARAVRVPAPTRAAPWRAVGVTPVGATIVAVLRRPDVVLRGASASPTGSATARVVGRWRQVGDE